MRAVRILRRNNCWLVETTIIYDSAIKRHDVGLKAATEFCRLQQLKLLKNAGIKVMRISKPLTTPTYAACRGNDFLFSFDSRSEWVNLHVLHTATYLAMRKGYLK